jgi:hypothetical protein
LIPRCSGSVDYHAARDALWARFFTEAPARQRRSVARYSYVKRACDSEPGLLSRELLEALDDLIAINRVELDEIRPPASFLGRNEGCSRSTEGVEHDLTAPSAVPNGVGHESDRLHSRVH